MLRERGGTAGVRLVWSGATPSPHPTAPDGIAQRLDQLQARLDALEVSAAGQDPQSPLAVQDASQEQERDEIRRLVADLTAEVLGANHPLVAPLRHARLGSPRPPGGIAPAPGLAPGLPAPGLPAPGLPVTGLPATWWSGGRGPGPGARIVSLLARWSPGRGARRRPAL
jgi:hypothetical protein